MKKNTFKLGFLIFTAMLCAPVHQITAQKTNTKGLPVYNKAELKSNVDWLLGKESKKSDLYVTPEGNLALSNGIVTRTFTLAPNVATIGLDNLSTNESLLRAVGPEAVLWVNGCEIKVGGLTGQPIGNYLLKKWIPTFKADPFSMKIASYTTNPIRERFEWNRHNNWMPKQLAWPPKGMELTFTYKADAATIKNISDATSSDANRKVLFKDDFLSVSPQWKVITEKGASYNNEGKAGEILAPNNSVAYAEKSIPTETQVIICKLNSGTDALESNTPYNHYGIGCVLVFADGTTSRLFLQPYSKNLKINHEESSFDWGGYKPGSDIWVKITFQGEKIICSMSENGETFSSNMEFSIPSMPTLLRVGKTDRKGGLMESENKGALGRSKIDQVVMLGAPKAQNTALDFLSNMEVQVHYEVYDGLPLMSKWVTIKNNSSSEILVNNVKSEHLACVEAESLPNSGLTWKLPPIFTETDYACGGQTNNVNNHVVEWQADKSYTTQVDNGLKNPNVLVCRPKKGMNQELAAGKSLEGIRLWELIFDSSDRERRGLSQRKLYRTISPWITENPTIMHVSKSDDKSVKEAIDQCANVGFEMVIMTFGSGVNLEDNSSANLDRMKNLQAYAQSKNIALGGYSLLASRTISKETDVVSPNGMRPMFSKSPCLQSEWGQNYFKKLYNYYETTGQLVFEHDGSYPGDVCASTTHAGHKGLEDSQWKQFMLIRDFYRWCRGKGIYLNIPDWYLLNGGSKVVMGYRETNWSLPREHQELIERQNIFDGTWEKTPSMGWMFVPLVQYHGGGAAATIEPLKEHLPHYEQRMANLFGAGVQACYRGPRLYDSPETEVIVKKWVDFFKKHRSVLEGDIIHIRRADGNDYDAILHVDPLGKEKGLLMVYNPLDEPIVREIDVDLYYTGLQNQATVSEKDGVAKNQILSGTKIKLKVTIPAKSQKWFVFN